VAAGIVYGALFIIFCVTAALADPDKMGVIDVFAIPAFLISWLGGAAHAAVLQQAVRAGKRQGPDSALAKARRRVEKRAQARALLASDGACRGTASSIAMA
jgi:hypothetical protein